MRISHLTFPYSAAVAAAAANVGDALRDATVANERFSTQAPPPPRHQRWRRGGIHVPHARPPLAAAASWQPHGEGRTFLGRHAQIARARTRVFLTTRRSCVCFKNEPASNYGGSCFVATTKSTHGGAQRVYRLPVDSDVFAITPAPAPHTHLQAVPNICT